MSNFEKSLSELQNVVQTLERGDSSLDESMKLLEKGMGLVADCNGVLNKAEQKVVTLLSGKDEKGTKSSKKKEEAEGDTE